jgi:membrane protease YdiL (CAAX protease family)
MSASGHIAAGGTLPREAAICVPGPRRRLRLAFEIALFFVGAPLAVTMAVHGLRLPLFLVLQPLLLCFVLYLLWDPTFLVKRELSRGIGARDLAAILALFLIAGGLITLVTYRLFPGAFLEFPRNRPRVWLLIMVLYPVLSVFAQEFVYRTFFFHRYGPLFGQWRGLAILTNAALFAFGHIIFLNWIAVAGSFAFGLLFAYRYERTRSLWAVCLEHSLYGCLAFTVGRGRYFFTGIASI